MKLSDFSVVNYRSITTARKIKTNNMTVLVGKNNEGKSNILRALTLAMDIMKIYSKDPRSLQIAVRPYLKNHYSWEKDYPISLQEKNPNGWSSIDLNFELDEQDILAIRSMTGIRLSGCIPVRVSTNGAAAKIDIPKRGTAAFADADNKKKIIEYVCFKIDFNFIPAVRTEYDTQQVDKETEKLIDIINITKSKILDLAIRGKLVPQNPNDEPASVLLERIRAEKEELIKQGKIKRDKKESIIFRGDDNSYYEKNGENIVNIADEIPFGIPRNWSFIRLKDVLEYEQPTPYIVESTDYKNDYSIPVLTAGKSFIIGYTNETSGIKTDLPVIIFDDFTTDSKYVDFPFKVKSSAMKILTANEKLINTKYAFYAMQCIECDCYNHKRYWISDFSNKLIPLPPLEEQLNIVHTIEKLYNYIEKSLN